MRIVTTLTCARLASVALAASMLAPAQASATPLLALPHAVLARFAATAEPLMIPEPASAALLIVGLTISAVAARKRRRPEKPDAPRPPG